MDLRRAIGVFTRPWHGFPCRTNWVEALHAKQGKRYKINNNKNKLKSSLEDTMVQGAMGERPSQSCKSRKYATRHRTLIYVGVRKVRGRIRKREKNDQRFVQGETGHCQPGTLTKVAQIGDGKGRKFYRNERNQLQGKIVRRIHGISKAIR